MKTEQDKAINESIGRAIERLSWPPLPYGLEMAKAINDKLDGATGNTPPSIILNDDFIGRITHVHTDIVELDEGLDSPAEPTGAKQPSPQAAISKLFDSGYRGYDTAGATHGQ